ncbi:winged helix-turn-helix transcriptional regulator [Nakamurella aerolata]|uniref:Helix-turn-helix transcriptional regulator n=1 Tax=Nakamurella aerolata TaxID=1656892 RepID=A0A849A027_9ACTN|nr:helix-turn-helix domain-containing protein [Nakamurella aerolata]NNG34414.1 helix-turn-helix transcriptional regulator [Nakamurella aerolata]
MALGNDYREQNCFLARALEVVGERWTLMILRDCCYGVRHFSDLLAHLDISRAVLAERLDTLVDNGLLTRSRTGRQVEYQLTVAGKALWPTIFGLMSWGQKYLPADHPPRRFRHVTCAADLDDSGRCPDCGRVPEVADVETRPAVRRRAIDRDDPVAKALREPHRMLTPVP